MQNDNDNYLTKDLSITGISIKKTIGWVVFTFFVGTIAGTMFIAAQFVRDKVLRNLLVDLAQAKQDLKDQDFKHTEEIHKRNQALKATMKIFNDMAKKEKGEHEEARIMNQKEEVENFKLREMMLWLWRFAYEDRAEKKEDDYKTGYPEFPLLKRNNGRFALLDKNGKTLKEEYLAVAAFNSECIDRYGEASPITFAENLMTPKDWYGLKLTETNGKKFLEWHRIIFKGKIDNENDIIEKAD